MLDLIKASTELYGDSYQTPPSTDVYIGGILATSEQMTAITAKATELEAEWDAQEYARNRRRTYPDWNIQLEKIADDGIDAWKADMLEPVKAKFPKP
jgi:hypothetical protein